MTTQEAYRQGVVAAESTIKKVFENIIRGVDDAVPFPDPHMEAIRQILKSRSDMYRECAARKTNVGKAFTKNISAQLSLLDKSKE